jgi:protein gp37
MSENSNIEWCDHTFNPFVGCTKVSPGCDNCYAEHLMDTRLHKVVWGPHGARVRTTAANWRKPIQWNAAHGEFFAKHGRRQRVFCASLADVFDNAVDPDWRTDLWKIVESTSNLDWLLLTKRVSNVRGMIPAAWLPTGNWPSHVRVGATVTNQLEADRDIDRLADLSCPNFLSLEPLLSAVNLRLRERAGAGRPVDWVIAGGESGAGARPSHPGWFRSIRDECAFAGVPFLFKQHGEWVQTDATPGGDLDEDMRRGVVRIISPAGEDDGDLRRDDVLMRRVGKKAAGRLLDGCLHNEFALNRSSGDLFVR